MNPMNDQPDNPEQPAPSPQPSSHVTNAPNTMPDHNYDPQIRAQYANEPKVVHAARRPDDVNMVVNEKNSKLHQDSVQKYPFLNLSDGEFVVLDVKRHPIGLLVPVLATGFVLLALLAVMIIYPSDTSASVGVALPSFGSIIIPLLLLMLLVGIGGAIAIWVYLQNQFYLTNESVIQEIQHSLFSRHEQTVSLGSIEDASFKQSGVVQLMFNYGTVRLSTEGEETTYRFSYVANPRKHVAILNNAIESFKNGRPVDPHEN
jgi:uncharacterized membrane protein YdbT with pleckstrin-like domain